MRKFIAAILAVFVLLPIFAVNLYARILTKTDVIYENDFNDESDDDLLTWQKRNDGNTTIAIKDDALVVGQSMSVGTTNWYQKAFSAPVSGTITICYDIKVDNEGDNPAFFIVRGSNQQNIIQLDYRNSNIGFNNASGWEEGIEADVGNWHSVEMIIDTDQKIIDIYVNDHEVEKGRAFREASDNVSYIQIGPYGGATQNIYIDNLFVTTETAYEILPGAEIYNETFDGEDSIDGWTLKSGANENVTITHDSEAGRAVIRQAKAIGSSNWFIKDVPESYETVVTVSATMALKEKMNSLYNAAFFFVYGDDGSVIAQVDMRNNGGDVHVISLNDHYSEKSVVINDVTKPTGFKVVVDFTSMTYDFYVEDQLLFSNLKFKDGSIKASKVTRIGAGFQGGVDGDKTMYIDDIVIVDGVKEETELEPVPVTAGQKSSAKFVYLNDELHAMVLGRRFIPSYHIIGDDGICTLCKGTVESFEPDNTPAPENSAFCERFNSYDATDGWSLVKGANPNIKMAVKNGIAAITQSKAPGSSNWYVKRTPETSSNIVTVEADISLSGEFGTNYNASFFIIYGTDSKMIAQVDYRLAGGDHRISLNDHYDEKYVVVDDVTKMHNVKAVIDFDSKNYDFYVDGELLFADLSFKEGSSSNAVGQVGAGLQGAVQNMTMYVDNIVITEGETSSADDSGKAVEARIEINAADALNNTASAWAEVDGSDEWVLTSDGEGVLIRPDSGRKWENTSENLSGAPSLSYKINVETQGTYYAYINMSSPDADSDSYHVMVDGKYLYTHSIGDMSGDKVWKSAVNGIEFSKGEHTITIVPREDGFAINKIVLTTDKNARFTDGVL